MLYIFNKRRICIIFILYLVSAKSLLLEIFTVTSYYLFYLYYSSYSIIARRNSELSSIGTEGGTNTYSITVNKGIKPLY